MANPMLLLGDMIYGGASPAGTPARVPGNQTANKYFLTQTGTGSASAIPTWATIAQADVPNPMNTMGDMIYGGASPAGVPTRLAPPGTTLKSFLTHTGSATAPAWQTGLLVADLPLGSVNVVGTTTYTFAASDDCKLVAFNASSAITATLTPATVGAGWTAFIQCNGLSGMTLAPSTGTIDGNAGSLPVPYLQGLAIWCDGTNFFTSRGVMPRHYAGQSLGVTTIGTDESTTSTTPVSLTTPDSVSFTLSGAQNIFVEYIANAYITTAGWSCAAQVFLDGTAQAVSFGVVPPVINQNYFHILSLKISGVSAASHTIEVKHFTNSGQTAHWQNRMTKVTVVP
jgi:hypothetical protein